MQVVILCGGMGTRIRDVADDIPKPMIPIGGRPILWHIMKRYADHGYRRFILCLGYRSWSIKQYFLDYPYAQADLTVRLGRMEQAEVRNPLDEEGWEITLAETGLETMTGGRVKAIERYLDGDEFHLTYGDGVADVDVRQLVDFHRKHGKTATVTAVQMPGRFGEIELNGDQVMEFSEKPLVSRGRINGGFFVFRRRLFDRLQNDPRVILEYGPLMQLARDEEMMAYLHDGFWQAMDNSRDFKYLNDLWSQDKAPWNTWEPPVLRAVA